MEIETAVYRQIDGHGIGPRFLGHVTEGRDGRVVGFATAYVAGARETHPEDLDACRVALGRLGRLGRLHALGIKSGDINKYKFLVRDDDGKAEVVLVDFETAALNCSSEELAAEMDGLESSLSDMSFRGGVDVINEDN